MSSQDLKDIFQNEPKFQPVTVFLATFLFDPSNRDISSSEGIHLAFVKGSLVFLGAVNIANLLGIFIFKKKIIGTK